MAFLWTPALPPKTSTSHCSTISTSSTNEENHHHHTAGHRRIINKHTGLTTGDLYFIPKNYESDAYELLATLDSLSYDYVEEHYDQDYTYHFNPRFSYDNAGPIVSGSDWPDKRPVKTEHALYASRDENGFYFLLIKTEGDLWMPHEFTKLKSWINGEKTYLKGMKPKD